MEGELLETDRALHKQTTYHQGHHNALPLTGTQLTAHIE